ncbi:hypothetical protein [Bacillus marasmi]|uniref:hypothetical protein n=1 Tax=Bacillus marasmi TaxID=1926279 RepID=UPI0011C90178|nr:hypothetical protein [Bacillus marasmi]
MGEFISDKLIEMGLQQKIKHLENKVERYESALKTIIELTSCDDTWDFANRTLEGKQRLELPYRFNRV